MPGKLRKALDVCRRAVELASQECSKAVHVSHIASVVSGSTTNYAARNTIPLQQKLVACALLVMVKGNPRKEVFLGKLYEAYVKLCKQRRLKFEKLVSAC